MPSAVAVAAVVAALGEYFGESRLVAPQAIDPSLLTDEFADLLSEETLNPLHDAVRHQLLQHLDRLVRLRCVRCVR